MCYIMNFGKKSTVPMAINASSRPNVRFFRRMYVLSDTATRERARKMYEIIMIASGKPLGNISLAEGSTPLEGVAIVNLG